MAIMIHMKELKYRDVMGANQDDQQERKEGCQK
jgi:hypothetical protein